MKITGVHVYEGYSDACAQNVTPVRVRTDAGPDGWGDFRLAVQEHLVAAGVRDRAGWLLGEAPFRIERVWQDLVRATVGRGGPVVQTASSALDTAPWDLEGEASGAPVYELRGGPARQKVRVARHVAPPATDARKQRLRLALDAGFAAVRVSLGGPQMSGRGGYDSRRALDAGVGEVRARREFCGAALGLCVDVHTRLNPIEAIGYCNAVAPYTPVFVEDALRSENPAVYRLVRSKTNARLAAGEHLSGEWAFRELLAENLVEYPRVDLCHAGGSSETKKVAAWAAASYEETALHCPSGTVGNAASLHRNLSIPNCAIQEVPGPGGAPAGLVEGGHTVEQGDSVPSGGPAWACGCRRRRWRT